ALLKKDQPVDAGGGGDRAQEGGEPVDQRLLGIGEVDALEAGRDLLEDPLFLALEQGAEEGVLRVEYRVDDGLGDSGVVGDGLHRSPFVAVLEEELQRRV